MKPGDIYVGKRYGTKVEIIKYLNGYVYYKELFSPTENIRTSHDFNSIFGVPPIYKARSRTLVSVWKVADGHRPSWVRTNENGDILGAGNIPRVSNERTIVTLDDSGVQNTWTPEALNSHFELCEK